MSAAPSSVVETEPTEPRPSPPELFSQDQLERHAAAIAGLYHHAPEPTRGRPLLPLLDEAAEELDAAYRFLTDATLAGSTAVGSEEWLRDNHHVVQDQVREIRQDLPRKYYFELAKRSRRLPCIHALHVRARLSRHAGRFDRDADRLRDAISASRRGDRRDLGECDQCCWPGLRAPTTGCRVVAALRSAISPGLGSAAHRPPRDVDRTIGRVRDEIRRMAALSAPFFVELLHCWRSTVSAAPSWHALQQELADRVIRPTNAARRSSAESSDQVASHIIRQRLCLDRRRVLRTVSRSSNPAEDPPAPTRAWLPHRDRFDSV